MNNAMTNKAQASGKFLLENILNVVANYAGEEIKEITSDLISDQFAKLAANATIDIGSSMIPGIGNAITSYRTNRRISNLDIALSELKNMCESLYASFEKQKQENKEILDRIFHMMLEKVAEVEQQEKITYMINGYSKMLSLDNPSFDIAYLYYDTLDKLTILDISVLKLMFSFKLMNSDKINSPKDYKQILTSFDINRDQYKAVKANLYRMGLLENNYDDALEQDVRKIEESIIDMRKTLKDITNLIKSGAKRNRINVLGRDPRFKIKTHNQLIISKFGQDFVEFFIDEHN